MVWTDHLPVKYGAMRSKKPGMKDCSMHMCIKDVALNDPAVGNESKYISIYVYTHIYFIYVAFDATACAVSNRLP